MPFTQHIPHARRQQIRLVRVVIEKFAHRASPLLQYKRRVKPSSHTDSSAPLSLARFRSRPEICKSGSAYNSFIINTYKPNPRFTVFDRNRRPITPTESTVTTTSAITTFRMNTYRKEGGGGTPSYSLKFQQLTATQNKGPSGRSRRGLVRKYLWEVYLTTKTVTNVKSTRVS